MLSYLKELFSSNPFVTSIDFSGRNVTVLDPSSLALLSRFTELRRIDLSDNLLRALPSDLSSLPLLLEFDLNGNPLDDLELAVDALRTLPNLKSLRINLHEEDQVDYLLRSLEYLQELNGLAVERDALFSCDDIQLNDEE